MKNIYFNIIKQKVSQYMPTNTSETEVLKGGEFLIKESNPQSVFIPEEITEEQKMMTETAREFVEKEIWPKLEVIC